MRAFSRETIVGLLLVSGLVMSGCQPVQPILVTPEGMSVVESEPAIDSVAVTETAMLTDTEGVAAMPVSRVSAEITGTTSATTTTEVAIADAVTRTTEVPVATSAVAIDPELVAVGLTVYRAQYCGVCHMLDAAETRGTFGPTHNHMGATAAARIQEDAYNGSATTAVEYIHESIVDPQAFLVSGFATTPHRMPSYAFLDADSVDALVAFLLAQ